MGFASKIATNVSPGVSSELRQTLEQQLVPAFEHFVANAPDLPPTDLVASDQLLLRFIDCYWPLAEVLTSSGGKLSDAFSAALDDVVASASSSASRRRSVVHLEEALSSLLRVQRSFVVWASSPAPALQLDAVHRVDSTEVLASATTREREYLFGVLAALVAVERADGDFESFAAWAWTARKTLLSSEATLIDSLKPQPQPPRIYGAWTGLLEVPKNFDDELPDGELAPFYESDI